MYLPIHPPNAFQPLYYYGFLENKWSIFHILFHIQQYKFLEFTFIQTHTFIRRNLTIGNKQLGSNHIYIYVYISIYTGLTKPGEVGEILALFRLKSLSLDCKAKLKSPCFFFQVTLFLQIIFIL
jgi:hypothetical protein